MKPADAFSSKPGQRYVYSGYRAKWQIVENGKNGLCKMIPDAHLIKKGDASYLKKVNETRLLYIIYKEGPVSRVDLSREASMSKAAVSEIINRLYNAGMLLEAGKGQSTSKGGKRPTLIRLNPDRGYVFGLEIKRSDTIVALANIDGDLLNTSVIEYEAGSPISTILQRIIREMENVLALKKISHDKLIAIGIGAPGQINYFEGNLLVADTLKNWAHEPISGVFQETFHVPVILENDVNTIALGEYLYGVGKDEKDLVCIAISDGIGAGIIHNQTLVKGVQGAAGEIGYIEYVRSVDRPLKYICNGHIIYGDILSEKNLFSAFQLSVSPGKKEPFKRSRLAEYLAMAESGNPLVCRVLDEYAYVLGSLCLNLQKTLNPGVIVLNGFVIENSPYLLKRVHHEVEESLKNIPLTFRSKITVGELKIEAGLRGAVVMALQTLFNPNQENPFLERLASSVT